MIIQHISDTHGLHDLIEIDKSVDLIIFSGDESNSPLPHFNFNEFTNFFFWFKSVPVKHKIFVAGNHSTAISHGLIERKLFIDNNIRHLNDSYHTIDGITFYGSPYTPTYGTQWVYNRARDKLDRLWKTVEPVDVLITHGPPKNILDTTINRKNNIEIVGDVALYKNIVNRINPLLHCFGHVHNTKGILNSGVKTIANCRTIFSNASVVEDGKFDKIISHGNLFEIDKGKTIKIL